MIKKLTTIFLAVVLLLSFAACTGNNDVAEENNTSEPTSVDVAEETVAPGEVEELPYIDVSIFSIPKGGSIPEGDSRVVEYLSERFHFNFELYGEQDVDAVTRLNVFLATNNMPDLFLVYWNSAVQEQGCAKFTMEELEQYMPQTLEALNKLSTDIGRDPETTWSSYMNDGQINQIPCIWYDGKFPRPTLWRQDILDELGKEVPETVEEWEEVFSAYYEKYETYCYSGCAKDLLWQTFTPITGSTGIEFWNWQVIDGKIVPGWTQPEQKEMLETLARWYEKGYIDKEFVTKDQAGKINDFKNGNTIVLEWVGQSSFITEPPYTSGSYEEGTVALVPEATFSLGPIPTIGSSEKSAWRVWDPFTGGSVGFGKQLEDDRDKLHRIMGFLETLNNDNDVFLTSFLGWEGEHWDWTEDGQALARPEFSTYEKRSEYGTGGQYWIGLCSNSYTDHGTELTKAKPALKMRDEMTAEGGLLGPDKVDAIIPANKVAFITEDGTDLQTQYSGLFTARDAMFVEIITGAESIEAFDEYVKMWNENGGAELEALANELNMGFWE